MMSWPTEHLVEDRCRDMSHTIEMLLRASLFYSSCIFLRQPTHFIMHANKRVLGCKIPDPPKRLFCCDCRVVMNINVIGGEIYALHDFTVWQVRGRIGICTVAPTPS
jgi:hypothetical protein